MQKTYDIVVTGAGPTGLMAAKTAAEKGLSVVVIERRKDVGKIRRSCCAHLILDDDYEDEEIIVKDGKIVFNKNKFEVNYDGPTLDLHRKSFYSPKGKRIQFAHKDGRPFATKVDKGHLLKGLWEECEKVGVDFLQDTVAYDAKENETGVELSLTSRGNRSTLKASKLIEAGGVNALITGAIGMNENRPVLTTAFAQKLYIEGDKKYSPDAYDFYYGSAYHSNAAVILDPSIYGENVFEVVLMGSNQVLPQSIFDKVSTDSPISGLFENTTIRETHGAFLKAYIALKNPCKGHVIAAGDSAAFIEVEIQGGLMCGFHAANAMIKELNGEDGYGEYTQWWQKSFEFNSKDYLQVAQGYALVPFFSDDDLDYLFDLTSGEVLEGTNSQYKTPKLLWNSILSKKDKIKADNQALYQKVLQKESMSLCKTFTEGENT